MTLTIKNARLNNLKPKAMENDNKDSRKILMIEVHPNGQIAVQVSNLIPYEVLGVCEFAKQQTLDFMSDSTHKVKSPTKKEDIKSKPTP